jgi:hypothetical protein
MIKRLEIDEWSLESIDEHVHRESPKIPRQTGSRLRIPQQQGAFKSVEHVVIVCAFEIII